MVAMRNATGVATIPCATFDSRIADAIAAAFSASLNSAHALMASMASFGPAEDICNETGSTPDIRSESQGSREPSTYEIAIPHESYHQCSTLLHTLVRLTCRESESAAGRRSGEPKRPDKENTHQTELQDKQSKELAIEPTLFFSRFVCVPRMLADAISARDLIAAGFCGLHPASLQFHVEGPRHRERHPYSSRKGCASFAVPARTHAPRALL